MPWDSPFPNASPPITQPTSSSRNPEDSILPHPIANVRPVRAPLGRETMGTRLVAYPRLRVRTLFQTTVLNAKIIHSKGVWISIKEESLFNS